MVTVVPTKWVAEVNHLRSAAIRIFQHNHIVLRSPKPISLNRLKYANYTYRIRTMKTGLRLKYVKIG